MLAIIKREIRNYVKSPLFWIGIAIVAFGVFQAIGPYLGTRYLAEDEEIVNDYPEEVQEADVYEGYVPATEEQRRENWEWETRETLISEFSMEEAEAEAVITKMQDMEITQACAYLRKEYGYYNAMYAYEDAAYRKGTREEINSYIAEKLENHTFSYYFSRKFADFAGLFMGFFATVLLSVLFWQDTRKNTYELLHTKPVSARSYVMGKIGGGFAVCLIALAVLNLIFWIVCYIGTRSSSFEVNLLDFIAATCLYILPNMLMVVSIYSLIALLFKNPLPAAPLLILYIIYSNMGTENADGIFGYYGRPLAIMVRFPGPLFDTTPPPMVLLNQSFLVFASIGIMFLSKWLYKRRRIA